MFNCRWHARARRAAAITARLVMTVETDARRGGCPGCGVVAVGHGRRRVARGRRAVLRGTGAGRVAQADLAVPRAGLPGRRRSPRQHELIAPRAKLTPGRSRGRPTRWRTTTRPSRRWPATWGSTGTPCGTRSRPRRPGALSRPGGWRACTTLGVDEHIWRPSRSATATGR